MTSNISLSPHFALNEFTKSATARSHGIKNEPAPEQVENLKALCVHTLEPLREALGLPIIITSGYRTKELNDIIVHASRKSQHMSGQAADFYVAQGPVQGSRVQGSRELLIQAFRLIIEDESIDFDQLIIYPTFIHVSYVSREKNRHQLTRASSNGAYTALSRADALSLA
jgi:hypothetical protein